MSLFSCPAPFLNAADFPSKGGNLPGRLCAPVPIGGKTVNCCLPCPKTDWVYPESFKSLYRIGNYVNVAGVVFCIFVLLSFAVLPVEKTHRHYLSVSLTVAVIIMEVAFIIPLGTRPQQCFNKITPNDMQSDLSCALSGAFLLGGGWCAVIWIFLRALSLHLQICWQVVTGRKFFIGAQLFGWSVPAVFLALALSITGVSYRFGDTCHINHANGLSVFWGPIITFAGAAIIIQFSTFAYCIRVYVKSLLDDGATTDSSGLPSYQGSVRTLSARQAYRRIQRVFVLQWRGMLIVMLIVVDVIFFAIVFLKFDESTVVSKKTIDRAKPWLTCLAISDGKKDLCLHLAEKLVVKEATVFAVLILLSMNGIWCLFFLGRWGMVTGWIEFFKEKFRRGPSEFVSVDARRFSQDLRTYEMLSSTGGIKSPEPAVTPNPTAPQTVRFSPTKGRETPDYFGREAKYTSPTLSFSVPKSPSNQAREWDPNATHARGNGYMGSNKI